ncbi:DUF1829 domain-containing protein [Fructilactobacillus hinvesii]|uniref:DUF1829 domain-containing protein n=1 Tax=Fructilactobacillus hinvesii TaxID=2940300 RepID=A0ABY5BTP6_9LACO|nr:DUF1828 domain-containing protein [Fructilactobacillus hinvesii]USS88508.1 DUF1829 domain-containing protein [Fructilactobacillus hinvesii]
MNDIKIDELKDAIDSFNQNNIKLSKTSNAIRIDTPFYNRSNDSIILYAIVKKDGNLHLTDGGYVIDDLMSIGINLLKSKKRRELLESKLTSFSVNIDEETHEIFTESSIQDFPIKQNLLAQSMMFVDDMFVLAKPKTNNLFIEDVQNFFDENDIRALEGPSFVDRNGMYHTYDFSIAGSKKKNIPNKLIKTLNTPNNDGYAKSLAMDVIQTRNIPNFKNSNFYTIINDTEKPIETSIVNLFNEQKITTVPFSKKSDYIDEFAL